MSARADRARERYQRAAHAMQSGVAMEQARGGQDGNPKHLRTGINSMAVTDAALAKLLIARGVLTEEEYCEAVADEMEAEVRRYEERLSAALGTKVTLG